MIASPARDEVLLVGPVFMGREVTKTIDKTIAVHGFTVEVDAYAPAFIRMMFAVRRRYDVDTVLFDAPVTFTPFRWSGDPPPLFLAPGEQLVFRIARSRQPKVGASGSVAVDALNRLNRVWRGAYAWWRDRWARPYVLVRVYGKAIP